MKHLDEPLGSGRRMAALACAIAFVSLALLGIATRARASETIYWENYEANPTTIGFSNLDGTGGGVLDLASVEEPGTEVEIMDPEGMAYDPASGRIYVASSDNDEIAWASTSGGGAGVLNTGATPVEDPEGIAIDPTSRTIYWLNSSGLQSIAWAKLDGSASGILDTTGATLDDPCCRVAIDPAAGRIYWTDDTTPSEVISYANLDGTGGGELSYAGSSREPDGHGLAVDSVGGRVYFTHGNQIGYAKVDGSGGGDLTTESELVLGPYGLAVDPFAGRLYTGNFDKGEDHTNAIGIIGLDGTDIGGVSPVSSPVNGPQDPVIVKSPVATAAPRVTASGTDLSCSRGGWEPDYPGSYVYAAPLSYAYQWLRDGRPIDGATGSTLTATRSGAYSCTVTAINRSGSASQTSAGAAVALAKPTTTPTTTPAKLVVKRAAKKAVRVKAGKVAIVAIKLTNGGGTASGAVRVCGKLTRKAKKGLVAPKCVSVASVPAGGTVTAKLRVRTRKTAKGSYKLTAVVSGSASASTNVHVKVTARKKHKRKHSQKHSQKRHH